jgi:hypothetical protein
MRRMDLLKSAETLVNQLRKTFSTFPAKSVVGRGGLNISYNATPRLGVAPLSANYCGTISPWFHAIQLSNSSKRSGLRNLTPA